MGFIKNLLGNIIGRRSGGIDRDYDLMVHLNRMHREVEDYIPLITQNIKPTPENPTEYTHITERINHIESMLSEYDRLMQEASVSREQYDLYDRLWNHCHNSKDPDFSLIDRYAKLHDELVATAPSVIEWERQHDRDVIDLDRRIVKIITAEQGILQTDLSKRFPESVKTDVRDYCRYLEKTGAIIREKHGKTYALYTN